jgi:aspartyl-tRNA synthetase
MTAAVEKGALLSPVDAVLLEICSNRVSFLPYCSSVQGLLTLPTDPHFLWITEFPLFTLSDADKEFQAHGRYSATHHPFTAPVHSDLGALKEGKVQGVRGQHYDLVLNGMEIGGGSVRIHDARLQEWVMREVLKVSFRLKSRLFRAARKSLTNGRFLLALQLEDDEIGRFSHLLKALSFGAPPHGGLAIGAFSHASLPSSSLLRGSS